MEHLDIFRFLLALGFVALLIYGIGWGMRRSGVEKKLLQKSSQSGRLKITDSVFIDPRTRLVIVQCDEAEHLLMVGQGVQTVVKQDIGK